MKINFLSNCNDTPLVQRSGSVWMHILKYKLDVSTMDQKVLHHRVHCSDRHAASGPQGCHAALIGLAEVVHDVDVPALRGDAEGHETQVEVGLVSPEAGTIAP